MGVGGAGVVQTSGGGGGGGGGGRGPGRQRRALQPHLRAQGLQAGWSDPSVHWASLCPAR